MDDSLLKLGEGALMAKIDLKAAFRMVPVRREDWELLGIYWQDQYYVDTCLPLASGRPVLVQSICHCSALDPATQLWPVSPNTLSGRLPHHGPA